jgi:hypothetical protein
MMVTEVYSEPVDDTRAVEVHVDEHGQHWVGMTHIRNPKDWEFHPRYQTGIGEGGRRLAVAEAQSIVAGIRFDAQWAAR